MHIHSFTGPLAPSVRNEVRLQFECFTVCRGVGVGDPGSNRYGRYRAYTEELHLEITPEMRPPQS